MSDDDAFSAATVQGAQSVQRITVTTRDERASRNDIYAASGLLLSAADLVGEFPESTIIHNIVIDLYNGDVVLYIELC